MISKWKQRLGLDMWVACVKISDDQIVYPDDLEVKDFVGIHIDMTPMGKDYGIIYHSRPLTEEDIVHELLHAKNPDQSEEWVVEETERMINYFNY